MTQRLRLAECFEFESSYKCEPTAPPPQPRQQQGAKKKERKRKSEKKGGCPRASGKDGDSRLGFSCPVFDYHLVFLFLKRGAFSYDATFLAAPVGVATSASAFGSKEKLIARKNNS